MARMHHKGQVVIPKAVRDQTGIQAGADLIIEARGREIVVRQAVDLLNYKPRRPRRDVGLSDKETIAVAIEDHVAAKFGGKDHAA